MVAHPAQLAPVPDGVADEAAVLVEPTACAVHAARAIRSGAAGAAGAVAVIGAGTLGLTTLAALRHLDAEAGVTDREVLVTAKHPEQKRLASALGATRAVAPAELARAVRSSTASLVVASDDATASAAQGQLTGGVPTVVDCVGSEASLAQALRVVPPAATSWWSACPAPPPSTSPRSGTGRRPAGLLRLHPRRLHHRLRRGRRRPTSARLLSATYPLARHREAIAHAAEAGARGAVKVAFDLRGENRR